jgi:hypothetical protein
MPEKDERGEDQNDDEEGQRGTPKVTESRDATRWSERLCFADSRRSGEGTMAGCRSSTPFSPTPQMARTDAPCEHVFVTSQGSPYMRFRRALDRGNVTEALSSASELEHVGLNEALELCLLLRDKQPARYPRAALRWHARLCREVDVSLQEAQAVLAALVLLGGERKTNAAFALAELLSRRGLERPCETLVAWAREE